MPSDNEFVACVDRKKKVRNTTINTTYDTAIVSENKPIDESTLL